MGRYVIAALLKAGYTVRTLMRSPDRQERYLRELGTEPLEGDVLDVLSLERAMDGCGAVVHAAAMVSFWKPEAAQMKRVNVEGTANVVNMALATGVQKLVHISSVAAIGRTTPGETITETNKWHDSKYNARYGTTKHMAELEVRRGVEEGLAAMMLSPGIILGKGQPGAISSRFVENGLKGRKLVPKGHVAAVAAPDVADAVVKGLASEYKNGERFILVGETFTMSDLFALLAKIGGNDTRQIILPNGLIRFTGRFLAVFNALYSSAPFITPETAKMATHSFYYDSSRSREALGVRYRDLRDWLPKELADS